MIIVCLEGCHGSGKTELTREFKRRGFRTFDEAFIDMDQVSLHPQSLTCESIWTSHWFHRALETEYRLREENGGVSPDTVYIADRSPYSSVYYSKRMGGVLKPLIQAQIEELREDANIHICTVYLKVEKELLWDRIQTRLQKEPFRLQYNEDSRQWMEDTVAFYENEQDLWDVSINNNCIPIPELMENLVGQLRRHIHNEEPDSPIQAGSPWRPTNARHNVEPIPITL